VTPLRPCLDCSEPSRGSRCPRHQREHERQRGTTAQRGYGPAWRRLTPRAKAAQPRERPRLCAGSRRLAHTDAGVRGVRNTTT
jgi:hypothetical protein